MQTVFFFLIREVESQILVEVIFEPDKFWTEKGFWNIAGFFNLERTEVTALYFVVDYNIVIIINTCIGVFFYFAVQGVKVNKLSGPCFASIKLAGFGVKLIVIKCGRNEDSPLKGIDTCRICLLCTTSGSRHYGCPSMNHSLQRSRPPV